MHNHQLFEREQDLLRQGGVFMVLAAMVIKIIRIDCVITAKGPLALTHGFSRLSFENPHSPASNIP
ncbi:MAG: membrane protein YdbS with pleckstrin-like domain [Candidatus Endobugula sp.]|jgi:membrane protein YdbS with pleckstrin-like domain